MQKSKLQIWAEEVAAKRGFKVDQVIYQGEYYSVGHVRNIILSGIFRDKPAVLKVYDDPRLSDEPVSLKRFNESNKSILLIAPELYDYEMASPKKGWLIMEKLPESGSFFESPLNAEDRKLFIKAFMEYRRNFPYEPTRELCLAENLPAHEFHILRIGRWLNLANDKEEEVVQNGGRRTLDPAEFIPKYTKGLDMIRSAFQGRKMIWCHGHVKPKEIYRPDNQGAMYLTDFAHTKMYPEGYELAFVIWADYLMAADWRLNYSEWREGIYFWIKDFRPIAEELDIRNYDSFIKVCLIERILGSILADIYASDKTEEEKRARTSLLMKLLDELM